MIEIIRSRVDGEGVIEQRITMKQGDEVKVRAGVFKDLVGILERPVSAAGRVRVLLQIMNALRIGVDVSRSLESTLDDIATTQLIEIQRYGKKLSSFTMFYMLLAIVLPSLGMTLFIVVSSLTSIALNSGIFFVLGFMLLLIQFVFIMMFRSIRPNINL
jgi:hypothetical protein